MENKTKLLGPILEGLLCFPLAWFRWWVLPGHEQEVFMVLQKGVLLCWELQHALCIRCGHCMRETVGSRGQVLDRRTPPPVLAWALLRSAMWPQSAHCAFWPPFVQLQTKLDKVLTSFQYSRHILWFPNPQEELSLSQPPTLHPRFQESLLNRATTQSQVYIISA